MRIPVLPLAYRDIQPLLAALAGPVAPAAWRGGLPLTYHIGPGPAKVHLKVQSEWSLKDIYDVVATIPGREAPDEWVIRGNHHDGWVAGAWDPLSRPCGDDGGSQSDRATRQSRLSAAPHDCLYELGRRGTWLARLDGMGRDPRRRAEAQSHRLLQQRQQRERGLDGREARSQALQRLVNEVAADVKDLETGVSVAEQSAREAPGRSVGEKRRRRAGGNRPKRISCWNRWAPDPDFTPFGQHLAIAALDLGFGGEAQVRGLYHSSYDTFDSFARFGDPDFKYGVALAETMGRLVLRSASAERMPFAFGDLADGVGKYLDEVHKLADGKRTHADELAQLLDDKSYQLAADPKHPAGPPEKEDRVPYFNLAPLDNATARLKRAASAFDKAIADTTLTAAGTAKVNALLKDAEQLLADERGLPDRPWYKHMIFAPGLFAGYGSKTLPGVREAIEEKHFADADRYAGIIAARVDAYAERLEQATAAVNVGK